MIEPLRRKVVVICLLGCMVTAPMVVRAGTSSSAIQPEVVLAAVWSAFLGIAAATLRLLHTELAWGPPISESGVLALLNLAGTLLSWSGVLRTLGSAGETAAYLLYFVWPICGLVLAGIGVLAIVRSWRQGLEVQAGLSLLLHAYGIMIVVRHFRAWE